MADRGTPRQVNPRDRTPIRVNRGGYGIDEPPKIDPAPPFENQSPRETQLATVNRLATPAAQRELTAHPAEGPVEVQYGGPLRRGGKLIYYRFFSGQHYFDIALGEGPISSADRVTIRFGDKSPAQVSCFTEIHLGVTGDTTSTIINAFETMYSVPEYIAHIVLRTRNPTQSTGDWNPFDFTVLVNGRLVYNPSTAATEFNGFPISAAWDALTNDRYSIGQNTGRMIGVEWAAAESYCEEEVDTGIPRWEFALLVDTQDTLDSWLKTFLAYCAGHLRYYGGQYGVYLERPRALALDGDGAVITFDDTGPAFPNTAGEMSFVQKGIDEIPTVLIVRYTDASAAYVAASVQIPGPGEFDPANEWIEILLDLPGIMTIERARRRGTLEFNLLNLSDKDITIPAWYNALQVLPGDRCRAISRKLIGAGDTPPHAGAIAGAEEIVITDVKMGDSPVVRAGLYREAMYGDVVNTSGPPEPPPLPPDPDGTPDCPTNLVALHAVASEYGLIEFTPPDDDSIISYYNVYDIFSGAVLVGTVNPPGDPLGGDGKYHKSFPALVHHDGSGYHVNVRVKSVSFAGNLCTPGPEDDWDEGPSTALTVTDGTTTVTDVIEIDTVGITVANLGGGVAQLTASGSEQESTALMLNLTGVTSVGYDPLSYTRILAPLTMYKTLIFDPTNGDFFVSTSTNASGLIFPKVSGEYYVSCTIGWKKNADSAFRALAFFRVGGLLGHAYISIDNPGSGYLTGDLLTLSVGTLTAGGTSLAGHVVASGGSITGIVYDDAMAGVGYTAVPTIGVTSSGGSGAVLTAHLPASFTIANLNFDCAGGEGSIIKGDLFAEDILPAVNSSSVPTRQHLGALMYLARGQALLVCVEQGSGSTLDLLGAGTSFPGAEGREGCRLSLVRVSGIAVTGEIGSTCAGG